ncbi:MAG: septum formation initiator family protein [Firmicutes bacterium]|nr:septum formation initiator family protein [Bacillota bacterium]
MANKINETKNKDEKKPKARKPRSKVTFFFLVFWAAIIGLSFTLIVGQVRQYNELRARAEELNANIEQLTAKNEELEHQIDFFDSDAYIERQARERLRMVRPDEIIFRNIAAE